MTLRIAFDIETTARRPRSRRSEMNERIPLPDRRPSWTQSVLIAGQRLYLTFGEYPDGKLGEVFITTSKTGTFARGVLDALARQVSMSLQCGMPVEQVAGMLQGLNFPPNGDVTGSPNVSGCLSVTDFVAQEMIASYHVIRARLYGAP